MRLKNILVVVLLVVLTVLSWYLWIRNAELRDQQVKHAEFDLNLNVSLYLTLKAGGVDKVQRSPGSTILGQTRDFERAYGVPAGTNSSAKQFARAQAIAAQVETNLVPITSIFPDSKSSVSERSD